MLKMPTLLRTSEKCFTLREMSHTWKNGSHLQKWVTPRTIGHLKKQYASEKWVTVKNKIPQN